MKDVMIIGGGTAGLTAAIYAVRAGLSVEVIESNMYGGQIVTTGSIDNYPGMPGVSGADFANALYEQAAALGIDITYQTIREVNLLETSKKIVTDQETLTAAAVIIAGGARPMKLGAKGEKELEGAGVSYCATCDGAFHRGKAVAVVGGGNTAIEDAVVLAGLCEKVYLIHRRNEFRAEQHMLDILRRKENVEWITDAVVEEIIGVGAVESVKVKSTVADEVRNLDVSGVFIAIGSSPNSQLYAGQLALDQGGYIIADESCITGLPGVFAAGDIRAKKVRQLVTAAADGASAALAASEYLAALR